MAFERMTLSPVKSQQRPLLFWSVMPTEGTLWLQCVTQDAVGLRGLTFQA